MYDIVNTIKAIVRQEMRHSRLAELGLVTEVQPHGDEGDSDNYSCDVTLKNSGLPLKRVPLATQRIGTVAPPNVGDLPAVGKAKTVRERLELHRQSDSCASCHSKIEVTTSSMLRWSTSPSAINPRLISSRSHAAAFLSCSL